MSIMSDDTSHSLSISSAPPPSSPSSSKTGKRPSKISSMLSRLQPTRPHLQPVIAEFYVRLDKPHIKYRPGDIVTGSIVLNTCRPMRLTHLTLTLSGSVMLYPNGKPANIAKEVLHKDKKQKTFGGRSRGTPISGSGGGQGVILFEDEQVVVGEGKLGAGGLEVGFVAEFPGKGLVSSLDFERGAISYLLTATLTRPVTLNPVSTCHQDLALVEIVDISHFRPPKPLTISIEPEKRRLKSSASTESSGSGTNTNTNTTPPLSPALTGLQRKKTNGSILSLPVVGPMATIELQKAAVLPGETIPLKISICHTRPIKSMSGIIITLSRQGRCDTFPLSIEPTDALTTKHLSFTKTSVMTFRMDLNQSFSPLIIDPKTLTHVVKASVRVPEDAFPSVSNVPGKILSFTYYVEVIVDLGGKLAQKGSMLSMSGVMGSRGGDDVKTLEMQSDKFRRDTNVGRGVRDGWLLETDRIRREKNVVSATFEVIVGTTNSANKRHRTSLDSRSEVSRSDVVITPELRSPHRTSAEEREQERERLVREAIVREKQPQQNGFNGDGQTTAPAPMYDYPEDHQAPPLQHYHPPMPPPLEDDGLDEKTRLRRAEERLLPSAPPLTNLSPSAPEDEFFAPSAPKIDDMESYPPSAPSLDDDEAGPSTHSASQTDDKFERERQRLMNGVSAPPVATVHEEEPSAPVIDEEDIIANLGHVQDNRRTSLLPRYER